MTIPFQLCCRHPFGQDEGVSRTGSRRECEGGDEGHQGGMGAAAAEKYWEERSGRSIERPRGEKKGGEEY